MECFGQLRLSYAMVTPLKYQWLIAMQVYFSLMSSLLVGEWREQVETGTGSWNICSEVASVTSIHMLFENVSYLARFDISGLEMCNSPTEQGSVYFDQ